MTKEQFNIFTSKSNSFIKKAKLFYVLFILICISLFIGMFFYQIISFFMTFIMIFTIMVLLFQFVFKEYIFYSRKHVEYKRISKHKEFKVSDEIVQFFEKDAFQKLYDIGYDLTLKNEVYVLASKAIENSIFTIALSVYFNDSETEAVSASPKVLSNELSNYILKPSIVKVILLVSNDFTEEERDYLKYNAIFHKNTVVIGLEKNTNTLYYNYFLNGIELDEFLGDFFKVDLTLDNSSSDEEDLEWVYLKLVC